MKKENKAKYIKVRISGTLKNTFVNKLDAGGITQSDFFNACILNYIGLETVPENMKNTSLKVPSKSKRIIDNTNSL